jgi:hypothetical protein
VLSWWRTQLVDYSATVTIGNDIEAAFGDGLAILALLHRVAPDALDYDAAVQRHRLGGFEGRRANLELAFQLADEYLVSALMIACAERSSERRHEPHRKSRRSSRRSTC